MSQQESHTDAYWVKATLGEIRRATLNGRLYPHPRCGCRRTALRLLRSAGLVEHVEATPTSLGGWFARPRT